MNLSTTMSLGAKGQFNFSLYFIFQDYGLLELARNPTDEVCRNSFGVKDKITS